MKPMNRISCPNCEKPCVSVLRVMFLGPAATIVCQHCSEKLGVSWYSVLLPIALVAAILFMPKTAEPVSAVLYGFGLMLLYQVADTVFFPVIKREP